MNYAFIGHKGSGKDTCCDILLRRGICRQKIAFAQALKGLCSRITGLPMEYFIDQTLKEGFLATPTVIDKAFVERFFETIGEDIPQGVEALYGTVLPTPRRIMQFIGTDLLRTYVRPTWNVETFDRIYREAVTQGPVCVSDLRFQNEMDYLLTTPTVFIFVRREAAEGSGDLHQSETELEDLERDCDWVLNNNGSLKELETRLLRMVDAVLPV